MGYRDRTSFGLGMYPTNSCYLPDAGRRRCTRLVGEEETTSKGRGDSPLRGLRSIEAEH